MMGEMPPGGHDGEVARPAELRASYQDRDRVAELLRVAAGDGRLTAGELDQRLEKALTARTYGELAALTKDLPATGGMPAGSHAVQPKDLVRIETTSGSARRDGRWVVPLRMEIKVTSGHVTLDFAEAVITQPVLRIEAQVGSGSLLLLTKPGVVVDADDVSVRSGGVKVRAPWGPDVPAVLHVQVSGQVRSGHISARPPRRTLWQWLLRRPPAYQLARP
jgi:uncharacterized protein DUF1707